MGVRLIFVLASSSCLAALGQLFLKLGAERISNPFHWVNHHVLVGLAFYAAGLVLWLYGLSRAPLYVVYPFAMLTFVLVGLLAIFVLGERPHFAALVGWAIILFGIAFVFFGSAQS